MSTSSPFRRKMPSPEDIERNVREFTKGLRISGEQLIPLSPVKIPDQGSEQAALQIETLYGLGDQLNIVTDFALNGAVNGVSKASPRGCGVTRSAQDWIVDIRGGSMPAGAAGVWLRLNPVKPSGSGKAGCYRDADAKRFDYALVECDGLDLEVQLSLLCQLAIPIVALTSSGGRSVHALLDVGCASLPKYKKLTTAILGRLRFLGVDPSNSNPSRMTRLAGAERKFGTATPGTQTLLYLNPNPDGQPIIST